MTFIRNDKLYKSWNLNYVCSLIDRSLNTACVFVFLFLEYLTWRTWWQPTYICVCSFYMFNLFSSGFLNLIWRFDTQYTYEKEKKNPMECCYLSSMFKLCSAGAPRTSSQRPHMYKHKVWTYERQRCASTADTLLIADDVLRAHRTLTHKIIVQFLLNI